MRQQTGKLHFRKTLYEQRIAYYSFMRILYYYQFVHNNMVLLQDIQDCLDNDASKPFFYLAKITKRVNLLSNIIITNIHGYCHVVNLTVFNCSNTTIYNNVRSSGFRRYIALNGSISSQPNPALLFKKNKLNPVSQCTNLHKEVLVYI